MTDETFESVYHQLQMLYQDQEFAAALELATDTLDDFPERRIVLDYWRMTMAARTGDDALTLQVLQQALARGDWYSDVLLRRSPSFAALQGDPQFEQLAAHNLEVAEADQAGKFPLLILRPEDRCMPGDDDPCALLVGLHANASTAQDSLPFWAAPAAAGWLVAAPQSSQAIWKDAYVWDDRDQAEHEVLKDFATLRQTYTVDAGRTVLAGHSIGAEVAAWMALRGAVAARGFLAVGPAGPWMDDIEEWEKLLAGDPPAGLRGAIVIGKEDATIHHENIRKLAEMLNRSGIPCSLEAVDDVGGDFSPEYGPALLRGLAFVIDEPDELAE